MVDDALIEGWNLGTSYAGGHAFPTASYGPTPALTFSLEAAFDEAAVRAAPEPTASSVCGGARVARSGPSGPRGR